MVEDKLGWGHFSTVWRALDSTTGDRVALKVQKSASHYTEAAYDEIKILKQVQQAEGEGKHWVVRLVDSFEHNGPHGRHICMVFEELGDNLLSLIKQYNYRGCPLPAVRLITYQILLGLDFLHSKCNIIHTDLKPENVLLSSQLPLRPMQVKVATAARADSTPPAEPDKEMEAAAPHPPPPPPAEQQPSDEPPRPVESTPASDEDASIPSSVAPMPEDEEEGTGPSEEPDAGDAAVGPTGPSLTKNQKKKARRKAKNARAEGGSETSTTSAATAAASGRSELAAAANPRPTTAPPSRPKPQQAAPAEATSSRRPPPIGADEGPLDAGGLSASYIERMECKIVDLGNACWTYKQFTEDIQTRQYRCPEVILGAKYGTAADMWSLACIVFELATGDLLFDPRSSEDFDRDEDHLALMQELCGRMPKRVSQAGKHSRQYFNRHGELRHIRRLRFWPLHRVLIEKYEFSPEDAIALTAFMMPMLDFVPENRATAGVSLQAPWLLGFAAAPPAQAHSQATRPPAWWPDAAPKDRPQTARPGGPASMPSPPPAPRPQAAEV